VLYYAWLQCIFTINLSIAPFIGVTAMHIQKMLNKSEYKYEKLCNLIVYLTLKHLQTLIGI